MHLKKIISIIITSLLSIIVAGLVIILVKNTFALKNNQISKILFSNPPCAHNLFDKSA